MKQLAYSVFVSLLLSVGFTLLAVAVLCNSVGFAFCGISLLILFRELAC